MTTTHENKGSSTSDIVLVILKNPSKSAGASVQSTNGSRDVRISGSNAEYTMFRSIVKGTGYPLHPPVSPSLPLPCVTACHHTSTGLYSLRPSSAAPDTLLLRESVYNVLYSV